MSKVVGYSFTCYRGEGTARAEVLFGGVFNTKTHRTDMLRRVRARKTWERCLPRDVIEGSVKRNIN